MKQTFNKEKLLLAITIMIILKDPNLESPIDWN